MPELPEVETVRRGLQPVLEGALIVRVEARRPDLRFPFPPRFANASPAAGVAAHRPAGQVSAPCISTAGPVLICHLGMSGSFRIEVEHAVSTTPGAFHHERSKDAAHDHVVFHVVSADGQPRRIIFNDPRRFGFMLFAEDGAVDDHPMLAGLGLEPTGNALDGALIADMLRGRKAPLKAALLDQRLIAGLGNIYVCEALWRARLSPLRAAGTIAGQHRGRPSQRADPARRGDPLGHRRRDRRPAARRCATISSTDGSLGYFQHPSRSTTAKASPARARLRRHHRAHRAERPLDLLLPDLPALG